MLKNNILIAFRLLLRQRIYSAINLIGLSIGMASFLVIVLFYQYQKSYDQFITKKDRIYRINRYMRTHDMAGYISKVSYDAAGTLGNQISGIEQTLRLREFSTELTYKENSFRETYMLAADPSFFEFFDYKFIAGDPVAALNDMNTIVLNEKLAKKYFGDEPAISKYLSSVDQNGRKYDYKVTGVIKEVPPNSHLTADAIISFSSLKNHLDLNTRGKSWASCHAYVLLEEDADSEKVGAFVNQSLLEHVPEVGFEQASFRLMPLTDIYFNPGKDGGSQRGSTLLTNILLLIGVFILLIASLNYVNLATARSLKRSKEVGIRKVSGANKKQLIYQFMGESVFICLVAMLVGLFLVYLIIPYINNFSNYMYRIALNQSFLLDPTFMGIALVAAMSTGLLSGLYPSFVISSFKPAKSLKGDNVQSGKLSTRKILVVTQYVVSIFLIVCCIAIYKVFDHLRNQNFGFDEENIVAIRTDKIASPSKVDYLKNQFRMIEGVDHVAATSKVPLTHRDEHYCRIYHAKREQKDARTVIYVDENYFDLLGIDVHQSLVNPEGNGSLTNGIFVNQLFIDEYGDQYSLGNGVDLYDDNNHNKIAFTSQIIGVVGNFKDRVISPKKGPMIFKVDEEKTNYLLVRLKPENQHATIARLESSFKAQHPYLAFSFSFLEDEMNFMFAMITPFGSLVYYATLFAIIIASMGLFALALFITQQRTKEVGIRKIFGSSEFAVSMLLAKQYVRLILISFLISGPLTFYGFKWIFQKFPEQIEMSWWVLAMVAGGLVLLALATVFGQSWKVARSNPVNTLRYE